MRRPYNPGDGDHHAPLPPTMSPQWSRLPALKTGETVEDIETGERYRVGRVTLCSASLHPVYLTPREVTITRKDGTSDTFLASESGKTLQVSPRAHFRRLA